MEYLVSKYPNANFICDEVPVGGTDGIAPKDLKALAKKILPNNIFWIACCYNHPKKELLEPGHLPKS